MNNLLFQVGENVLGVSGRIHTDTTRPALVVVNGSFPPERLFSNLIGHFAGASVLIVNLPGMAGVFWGKATVAGLTGVLEDAMKRLLVDAPIVLMGVSTGNLVTLGARLPNICHRVACEPFLQTKDLWPFVENSRERLALNKAKAPAGPYPYMKHFFWEFFGIDADRLENRDYRHLAAGITVPTDVLFGEMPLLPRRPVERWPSFTSAEDRELFAANPLVTLHQGPAGTGHEFGSVPQNDPAMIRVVHLGLRRAIRAPTPEPDLPA